MRIVRPAGSFGLPKLWSLFFLGASALAAPGCADLGDEHDGSRATDDLDTGDDGTPYDESTGQSAEEIAVAGGWKPTTSAINAGMQQFVAYDPPPPWDGGIHCGGSLLKPTRELGDFIDKYFSGMSTYGGYSCRQNTANASETSVHGTGRALDLMIPTIGGQADNSKGDPIANWLISNAQALGVQYLIWDHVDWGASRSGTKLKTYTGPIPHIDHIHVEISNEAAAGQTRVFGKVNTGGGTLTLRTGAGTSFASIGSLDDGQSFVIRCQKVGQSITGTSGTTKVWDNTGTGFVSHAFVSGGVGRIAACP